MNKDTRKALEDLKDYAIKQIRIFSSLLDSCEDMERSLTDNSEYNSFYIHSFIDYRTNLIKGKYGLSMTNEEADGWLKLAYVEHMSAVKGGESK